MIRTYKLECKLRKNIADAFNLESGRIYTQVLVTHWRVFRHTNHWLSHYGATKLNDWCNSEAPKKLYSHTIDIHAPTNVKHRMPHNMRLMRRCPDTGQSSKVVARASLGNHPVVALEAAGL